MPKASSLCNACSTGRCVGIYYARSDRQHSTRDARRRSNAERAAPPNGDARPEALRLSKDAGAVGFEGNVLKATYLGSHIEYTVASILGELFVVTPQIEAPGSTVTITLAERSVTLVRG